MVWRFATVLTPSRSASRRMATICSSVKLDFAHCHRALNTPQMWASKIPLLAIVLGLPGQAPAVRVFGPKPTIASELIRTGAARMVQLGELMMILDLHRQGLSITTIARRTGRDPKTVRKYIA